MSIWGKIIGGTAGFAIGGPIGAILGVIVGGTISRSNNKNINLNKISHEQKQNFFALSVIILSAKIAKADGQVTKEEIYAFKDNFKVPENEMSEVGKIFNEAKKSKDGYEKISIQIGVLFSDNKLLLEELLNNLFYIAEADGETTFEEINILKSISTSFGLSAEEFERIKNSRKYNTNSDPYKILGVKRDDEIYEIRKKWIELSKEHHPDNLLSKGLPNEFIDQANKELSVINLAYDEIKKQKGIS